MFEQRRRRERVSEIGRREEAHRGATAPASSPQKGQGSGSRQQSRRENGQVRESSAGAESQDTVLEIGRAHV